MKTPEELIGEFLAKEIDKIDDISRKCEEKIKKALADEPEAMQIAVAAIYTAFNEHVRKLEDYAQYNKIKLILKP